MVQDSVGNGRSSYVPVAPAQEERTTFARVPRVLLGAAAAAGLVAVAWTGTGVLPRTAPVRSSAASRRSGLGGSGGGGGDEIVLTDEVKQCSVGLENCNATQCCEAAGSQCYEQSRFYAQCRESCVEGPIPQHWDGQPWSCQELGTRTDGSAKCSAPGADCRDTKCCTEVGTQCFEKDGQWATCKSECIPGGPDLFDKAGGPWSCTKLGPWTPGASPWVQEKCADEDENCAPMGCCRDAGSQCFKQSDYWAQCKETCVPGKDPQQPWAPDWSCESIGSKTPSAPVPTGGKVGEWVLDECAKVGDDCSSSKCCLGVDLTCYEKDDNFAMCMEDCTAGRHAEDNNATWRCKPLGPRSHGLAIKGSPSIFCWSLIQTTTYEIDVIRYAMNNDAGIFGCDEFSVLSTDKETVIGDYEGKPVKTLQVQKAEITTSLDGTSGNAKLFMNCWNVVIEEGKWRNHAWTLKVDPDAVMVASRVRAHMAPHFGEKVYVVNCNKFPTSPNFPMMYGALEVFSFKAIDTYARNSGICVTDMGVMLPKWGEDYYMTHCLDHIGVGRIADFGVLGDWNCLGNNCGDKWTASFHPFKTVETWATCLNATRR